MINPLVSIGLPTYNRPDGLKKTIEYLLNQEYQNIEIIISDNHSSNEAVGRILDFFRDQDQRLSIFIQAENIGAEKNFNFVYNKSKGEYFFWITDDDEFSNNYISACVDFLEQNPSYYHCGGIVSYTEKGKFLYKEKNLSLNMNYPILRMFAYFYLVNKNGVFYGLFRNTNKLNEPIGEYIGSDWVHIARLSILGKIKVLETCEAHRDAGGGSATRQGMIKRWQLNKLQSLFFETYSAFFISRSLFDAVEIKGRFHFVSRTLLAVCLFGFLNVKFLLNSIRRRVVN